MSISTLEQTISRYLERMNVTLTEAWLEHPAPAPGLSVKTCGLTHMGVSLRLILEVGTNPAYEFFTVEHIFCYLPKANLAPLFRRLLVESRSMSGAYFFIDEASGTIGHKAGRFFPGLDYDEFKLLLDTMGNNFWNVVNPLVQEFQLSQQPP